MAKKLTEDELKWILSVDATKAQQEVRALTKDNSKLNATNKELKGRMLELIAAGKKESDEFKNLSKEVERNNEKIDRNKTKVKALEGTLGLTALTMTQLRKQAKDLQRQLDNTSDSLDPENYKKLERNLAAVKSRMAELRNSGQMTGETLSTSFSKVTTIVKGFLALKVIGYLKDLVSGAIETRKEFAKYEAVLRNTFQSQEKAAASMAMLKRLAQETPYSLQEVTEAYIKMVNRGITPVHDEIIKLGDLASSQGKSLDQLIEALLDAQTGEFERLKEFGIKANKENDKVKFGFKGITTEVQFSEKAITDYLYSLGDLKGVQGGMAVQMEELEGRYSNLGDTWDSLMNKIGAKIEPTVKSFLSFLSGSIQKASDAFTPLNEAYQEQFDNVVSLETKLPPLISRYDELKSKTNLSKEEHEELNRTINGIANIVPGAITAFDEYGNAIELNTEKVYQFLEAEQNRLKYIHSEAIEKAEDDLQEARKMKQKLEKELAVGGKYKTDRKTGDMFFLPYTEDQINQKVELVKKYGAQIQGAEETVKKLSGESLREQVENQKAAIQKRAEFNAMTKEQLDAYIKENKDAADKYVAIAKEIYEHKFKEEKKPVKSKEIQSALDLKLKEQENAHQAELTLLKNTQIQSEQTEQFYNLQRLSADTKFYQDRLKLLKDYQKKSADPKLATISKEINAAQATLLDVQQKRDSEIIKTLQDNRDKRLKTEEQSYQVQQITLNKALTEKSITQQQYDALMLSADAAASDARLKINQDYQSEVASLELSSGAAKAQAVLDANDAVMNADLAAAKSRAAQQKMLQNLVKDFKSEFKLTTVDEDTEAQMAVLEASYQARKELAEKENMDTAELDAAYERAKTQLLQQEEDKRNRIRSQYGLLSMQEQYEIEQEQLKMQYEQGLIDEEEYQKAKEQIKVNYLKKSYDYYSNMFSGAITALQDAELANIDAKYNAEIQRAGDNSEEVARLEQEKENKKLAVQKKYAGVQFAIKVSEIIANTAVSIMQAFAQLGPIGGAIAAAMLTATGAAQIAIANAERKKVMSMSVDGTSGSSNSNTGSRVITGRQSGGYLDVVREQDGKEFNAIIDPDKRGYIDKPTVIVGDGPAGNSREWVASNDALQNPTVAPIIQLLNETQEKGEIRTVDMNQLMRKRLAGFESGGSISSNTERTTDVTNPSSPADSIVGMDTINKLYDLLQKLDREGLKAYVVYSDLERKKQTLEKTRKLGGK